MPSPTSVSLKLSQCANAALLQLSSLGELPTRSAFHLAALNDFAQHDAGSEILAMDGQDARFFFVTSGWAAKVGLLRDGRRQIINLVLPGEAVGASPSLGRRHSLTVAALTSVVSLNALPLHRFIATAPDDHAATDLAERLAALAEREQEQMINQIVRLGRQSALERVCSLLLELRDRLKVVGLAGERWLSLPLTQEALADVAGLSVVHCHRVLKQLRAEQVLELQRGRVVILDIAAMEAAAGYPSAELN
jgi:CRP-like cAMP-binding protein